MRRELPDPSPENGHATGIATPQANTTVEPEMQVLLSGTGMPTLRTIAGVNPGIPVLSSNLCLAWAMTAAAGGDGALEPWLAADAQWRTRLSARIDA
jgi:maleate cis-trans isomerase